MSKLNILRIIAYIIALAAVILNLAVMLGGYQHLSRLANIMLMAAIVLLGASLVLRIIWPAKGK